MVNNKLVNEVYALIQEAVDCREDISTRKTAIEVVEKVGAVILESFNKYTLETLGDLLINKSVYPHNAALYDARADAHRFAQNQMKRIVESL